MKPQENGSHFGCARVTITDGAGAVTVTSPEDFSFNLSHYTQEEMTEKMHNYELTESPRQCVLLRLQDERRRLQQLRSAPCEGDAV